MTHARTTGSEALTDRRRLADTLGLPPECPHDICRRAGRCRGPHAESAAFPGEPLPGCLAESFDALYRPVARWDALLDMIGRAETRLVESDAMPDGEQMKLPARAGASGLDARHGHSAR